MDGDECSFSVTAETTDPRQPTKTGRATAVKFIFAGLGEFVRLCGAVVKMIGFLRDIGQLYHPFFYCFRAAERNPYDGMPCKL